MSAYPLLESSGDYSYDFTILEDQVWGDADAHKEIAPGIWGMIGGDGYKDEIINVSDYNPTWTGYAGESGYLKGDYNLDKNVNNQDKNDLWYFNQGWKSQVPD